MNYLIIESLERLYNFYEDSLEVEYPPGRKIHCQYAAMDLCSRFSSLFLKNVSGKRPCHGEDNIFNTNPNWKDLIYFYEHFHGETGRGLGATHQTGWTALVANCLFKLGSFRTQFINQLPSAIKSFAHANWDTFHKEVWTSVDVKKHQILEKSLHDFGFKTVPDMMEYLFHNCDWEYRNTLVRYCWSAKSNSL